MLNGAGKTAKQALCASPTFTGGVGFDGYAVFGGSVGVGGSFDPRTGQVGVTGSLGVGVGAIANGGVNIGGRPSRNPRFSGSLTASAGGALLVGPTPFTIGGSGSFNILGSTGSGFDGASGSIVRAGVGTGGGFANIGANVGGNIKSDLLIRVLIKCKKYVYRISRNFKYLAIVFYIILMKFLMFPDFLSKYNFIFGIYLAVVGVTSLFMRCPNCSFSMFADSDYANKKLKFRHFFCYVQKNVSGADINFSSG